MFKGKQPLEVFVNLLFGVIGCIIVLSCLWLISFSVAPIIWLHHALGGNIFLTATVAGVVCAGLLLFFFDRLFKALAVDLPPRKKWLTGLAPFFAGPFVGTLVGTAVTANVVAQTLIICSLSIVLIVAFTVASIKLGIFEFPKRR